VVKTLADEIKRYRLPRVSIPVDDEDVANKKYVDDSVSGTPIAIQAITVVPPDDTLTLEFGNSHVLVLTITGLTSLININTIEPFDDSMIGKIVYMHISSGSQTLVFKKTGGNLVLISDITLDNEINDYLAMICLGNNNWTQHISRNNMG